MYKRGENAETHRHSVEGKDVLMLNLSTNIYLTANSLPSNASVMLYLCTNTKLIHSICLVYIIYTVNTVA
jgi:hypothetical protein